MILHNRSTNLSVSSLRRPWKSSNYKPVFAIEPDDVCKMNASTPGSEWSTGNGSTSY